MIRRIARPLIAAAVVAVILAPAADAASFDFIYGDRIDIDLCSGCSGLTLAGIDYGLMVNKGVASIGAAEFFGTQVSATSSNPNFQFYPFFNNPGPPVAPILPNEAVGSVLAENTVLLTKLLPGETHRNTASLQVIAFQLNTNNTFGSAVFDITMTMGTDVARFSMLVNVTAADIEGARLTFPSAARVSSVPFATPARPTTWGKIKALYRR